jgi:hypothetical protein
MADYLEALSKASVVLTIDALAALIGYVENRLCVVVYLSSAIDLKLNSHKQIARTVEYRLGLIIIGAYSSFAFELSEALVTVWQIVVIIVDCVIVMDKASAILAGGVVVLVATVAKVDVIVTLRIITPDALGTVVANGRIFV